MSTHSLAATGWRIRDGVTEHGGVLLSALIGGDHQPAFCAYELIAPVSGHRWQLIDLSALDGAPLLVRDEADARYWLELLAGYEALTGRAAAL